MLLVSFKVSFLINNLISFNLVFYGILLFETCVDNGQTFTGDTAIFSSPWLMTTDWIDYNCNLTFWYHMKGDHIGQLDVTETSTGYWGEEDKNIWTRDSSVVS